MGSTVETPKTDEAIQRLYDAMNELARVDGCSVQDVWEEVKQNLPMIKIDVSKASPKQVNRITEIVQKTIKTRKGQ